MRPCHDIFGQPAAGGRFDADLLDGQGTIKVLVHPVEQLAGPVQGYHDTVRGYHFQLPPFLMPRMRPGPLYTLMWGGRAKQTSVIPSRRAISTPEVSGAVLLTISGMPAR